MGGVLFIDEAYALVPKNASNDFGNEAITTLLKRMEDDRGKFIVIAAGYSDDMDQFLAANDGLPSRFSREIIFEDYTGPELTCIFKGLVRGKNMQMSAETEQAVGLFFDDVYAKRDKAFDNGRGVHKIFRESILRQADRIQRLEEAGEDTSGILNLLEIEDITDKKPEPVKTVDEVLFELDQLTGLHQVKKEIRSLVNFIEIEKIRQQAGGESTTLNLH